MKLEKIFSKTLSHKEIHSFPFNNSKNIFVKHFLFHKIISILDLKIKEKNSSSILNHKEALEENLWDFTDWNEVVIRYKTIEDLYEAIKKRQAELAQQK